jgi:hypothetical protein
MSLALLPGYPVTIGAKRLALLPNGHAGPTSYTQMTTGPLAGGDVVNARDFGLKFIENIDGGITADGLFRVEPVQPVGPATSVSLRWTVVSTGAQVAGAFNLSGSTINMVAIGI